MVTHGSTCDCIILDECMSEPASWRPTPRAAVAATRNITDVQRARRCARHGVALPDYAVALALVGRESRGVLARGVGLTPASSAIRGERTLVDGERMPGARWFPDARLNFAENLLAATAGDRRRRAGVPRRGQGRRAACRTPSSRRRCRASAQALRAAGVRRRRPRRGVTCPNMPETISRCSRPRRSARSGRRARPTSACRACSTASARSSRRCCSPSTATGTTASRMPIVDKVADDRRAAADASSGSSSCPTSERRRSDASPTSAARCTLGRFRRAVSPRAPIDLRAAAVRPSALHPLFVGHDRRAKCIVHGAGGTLLQHLKEHRLHGDVQAPATGCSISRRAAG